MRHFNTHSNASAFASTRATTALIGGLLFAIAVAQSAVAQSPASEQPASAPPAAATAPATQTETPAAQAPSSGSQNSSAPVAPAPKDSADSDSARTQAGGITEDQLRQMFAGKTLYLRGGYLDNALTFDEHGKLIGHSPQGSYTLSLFMVDKVQLSKHKVELTGSRYGLHFLGALPNEDPTKAVDRVKITPKKKFVRITIDRELVVTPKKKKEKKGAAPAKPAPAAAPNAASADTANAAPPAAAPAAEAAATVEQSDVDAAKAEMAAAPEAERPADAASVTTTTSPAHAAQVLRDALDKIFAPNLDQRMIDGLPSFWKLYYLAAATQSDYKPSDPGVYRQRDVDQKAKLTSRPSSRPLMNMRSLAASPAWPCITP